MIFENAYYGETPIYRAYFAGELVWEAVDDVFPRQTLQFAYHNTMYFKYFSEIACDNEIVSGKQYMVEWDEEAFLCTTRAIQYTSRNVDTGYTMTLTMANVLGNAKILDRFGEKNILTTTERETSEPFLVNYNNKKLYWYTKDNKSEHTVRIYEV